MDWWKRQNFINTLKKLEFDGLLSMHTCQKKMFHLRNESKPTTSTMTSRLTCYVCPVTQLAATLRCDSHWNLAGFVWFM